MPQGGAAREWPLLGFTLLLQTTVGAFWTLAAAGLFPGTGGRVFLDARSLLILLLLGGAATLLSLFHLGRPRRAPNALANLRASWLSREILADLVFLGAGGVLWLMEILSAGRGAPRTLLIVVALAAGFLLLFAMSRLYMLRTVPVWRGAHTPTSFFLSALLLGPLAAALIAGDPGLARSVAGLALAALSIAFFAMAALTPSVGAAAKATPTLLAYPKAKIMAHLTVRTILSIAAAASFAVFLVRSADGSPAPLSFAAGAAFALASEITGRALFYSMYSRVGV